MFKRLKSISLISGVIILGMRPALATPSLVDDDDLPATNSITSGNARYGLFDWLDRRSAYTREFFPQPLLVDDTSLEREGELEFSSFHTRANDRHTDSGTAEVQKSFGLLTLELAVPYERDADADGVTRGVGGVELGARYPIFQFVSAKQFFDNTLGAAVEVGIPTQSAISKNTELDPKMFNDLKLGENFSFQSVFGYSTLFGPGDDGGLQTFEYGFAFAWAFSQKDLPLPGVQKFIPMFEIVGERGMNKDEAGQNSLLGSIGFRLDLKPIGELQTSLGLGYVFPMDRDARNEVHWGIVTSLIFEF